MKATDFEELFNNGESVIPYVDLSNASRPNKLKRVNIDFPLWMVEEIDSEAKRIGITRQSLIKVWISNCIKEKTA